MRIARTIMNVAKAASLIGVIGTMMLAPIRASASSHREAPLTTTTPKVDGTDFYMFRSYEPGRDGFVTIVADYQPLQDPFGGPNYFYLDPDAIYEIHIDNVGDGRPHITYQFKFTNTFQNLTVPAGDKNTPTALVNNGPITAGNNQNLNVIETYTANVIFGDHENGHKMPISDASTRFDHFHQAVRQHRHEVVP